MEAVQTRVEHPTFETVWAALQENAAQLKETERIFKENFRENARIQAEQKREIDLQMKEYARKMEESAERLDRQLGKLGGRLGEMIEYMVKPNLVERFRELGYEFEKAYPHANVKDRKNNIFYEVDITLENGDKVMIVEVKSKPTTEDITEHIERMEKVRTHANLHGDKRTYLGAIAGMIMNENAKKFALKNGFYAIEPSGETFIITAPEGADSPREW